MGPLLAPVSWWARISVRHDASVLPSERISGDLVGGAAGDGLVDEQLGVSAVVGEVDVADRLLAQPGAEQLVMGVTDPQPE